MPPVRLFPALLVALLACTAQAAWADPRPATRIHHAEPIDLPAATLAAPLDQDATNDRAAVTLRVAVPADVLVVDAALAEQGSCTVTTGQVTCSLGSIAAASTRRVDLDLRGTRSATTTIEASLTADNDADSRNNRVSATIAVAATAGTSTGGGATDLALLGLLLSMLLMRGLTRRQR